MRTSTLLLKDTLNILGKYLHYVYDVFFETGAAMNEDCNCLLQDFLRVVKCKMRFCKLMPLHHFVFDMSLKALMIKRK